MIYIKHYYSTDPKYLKIWIYVILLVKVHTCYLLNMIYQFNL